METSFKVFIYGEEDGTPFRSLQTGKIYLLPKKPEEHQIVSMCYNNKRTLKVLEAELFIRGEAA